MELQSLYILFIFIRMQKRLDMKTQLLFMIVIFFLIIINCTTQLQSQISDRYFDEQGAEITRAKFAEYLDSGSYLGIKSGNDLRMINRLQEGTISKELLNEISSTYLTKKVGDTDLIVINYYPGKDKCNSSGIADKSSLRSWHRAYRKKLKKKLKSKPLYVYKDKEDLGRYKGVVNYVPDQSQLIERNFFKYHYPCFSFVIIDKDGAYISWFGEYHYDHVINLGEKLINKKAKG